MRYLILLGFALLIVSCHNRDTIIPASGFIKFHFPVGDISNVSAVEDGYGNFVIALEGTGYQGIRMLMLDQEGNLLRSASFNHCSGMGNIIRNSSGNYVAVATRKYREDSSHIYVWEFDPTFTVIKECTIGGFSGYSRGLFITKSAIAGSYNIIAEDGSGTLNRQLFSVRTDLTQHVVHMPPRTLIGGPFQGKIHIVEDTSLAWFGTAPYGPATSDLIFIRSDTAGNTRSGSVRKYFENDNITETGSDLALLPAVQEYIGCGAIHRSSQEQDTEDILLVGLNSKGDMIRDTIFHRMGAQEARSLAVTGRGNVFLTGYTFEKGSRDCILLKMDENLSISNTKIIGDEGKDEGHLVLACRDAGMILIGTFTDRSGTTYLGTMKFAQEDPFLH